MSLSELRYAARTLIAGRLFTCVAIACLTLGIATNTTMFSVFDAMFLRPLPFAEAGRLLSIAGRRAETARRVSLSLDDLRDLTASIRSMDTLAAYSGRTSTLTDGGEPERIGAQLITASLFPMLGESPRLGHGFDASDDRPAGAGVALISDSLWRRRYQSDPAAIGRVIRLDNAPYTIVGVMPPKFQFPSRSELWVPMAPALGAAGAATRSVSILGRLARGTTLAQANAELAGLVLPARGRIGPRAGVARTLASTVVGGDERVMTGALMGATTMLLLMACVNVANLLLARGAGRRREIAVRAALGASRSRIVRQLLIESLLLALVASVLALPLAWYGISWVHDAVPPTDPLGPYYMDWSLDVRTFVFSITSASVTGLAFGIIPAFDAAGRHLNNPLREGAGAAGGRVQSRVHSVLIVAQTALAVMLLAGAALFGRTYAGGLRGTELGYDTSHLMTMRVYLAGAAYDTPAARERAVDEIAKRLNAMPGAHAATVSDLVPLDDQGGADALAAVEGRKYEEGHEPTVQYAGVAGRWAETFDLRVLAGRTFFDHELQGTTPVALVNAQLAATFWPNQNAIGRRFRLADDASNPWLTVIGVVPDIRTVKLDESRTTPPTAYLPHRFISTRNYGIIVRTQTNPESITPSVRDAVHAVDPSVALFDVYPMEQVRWLSYWMYVLWGTLFGVFGLIAVVVAAVGVYGVVFFTVAQRTREIGLRVALGAQRIQVVGPIIRHIVLLSAVGLAIGIGGALAAAPAVASLLIGVSANDPVGLAAVSALLALVAVAATWFPAWRASAVDPMVALRDG